MSSLENKLSASMHKPRRPAGTGKPSESAPTVRDEKAPSKTPHKEHEPGDLNSGGGRERNPERIWPD